MKHLRITCEGKATEPAYLESLRAYLRLEATVIVETSQSPDPVQILKQASRPCKGECWIVLDAESHAKDAVRRRHLGRIIAHCIRKGRPHLALSNPSFEYWLLLHELGDPRAYATPQAITARLEREWGQPYLKGALPLERLISGGRWKDALERARALRQAAGPLETAGQLLRQRPFTTVDALVERLVLFSGSIDAAGAPSGEPQ